LPKNKVTDVLGYQLLKSGTSIGATYREANRAESRNDFIHKIGIVETARLIVSDWWSEKVPVGPIGRELMYNFIRGMNKAPIQAVE
jgi:hypothetical protein